MKKEKSFQSNLIAAWGMCLIGALFYSYEYLLRVAPSVMIPHIMSFYQIDSKQVGILSAYYFYAYTPLQLVAGTLIDHYGARLLLTLATISCAFGVWFFGFYELLWTAKLGRFMIGVGSAFAFVGVMKIAADWLPNKWFALVAGLTTTLGMLGAIGGEMVLSELISWVGIHQTLGACIGIGVALTILTWVVVRDPEEQLTKETGGKEVKKLFHDLLKIAKIPKLWLVAFIGLCLFMPTTVFAGLWSIRFLNDIYHISKHSGMFSSLIFLGWAFGGPFVGWLSGYIGRRKPILITGALGACICAILIFYGPIYDLHILAILLFLFGCFSSAEILVFAINHDQTPQKLCGTAVALTNMIIMLGGFFQPFIGWLLDLKHPFGSIHYHVYSVADYHRAMLIFPISFFLAFIFTLFFKEDTITKSA